MSPVSPLLRHPGCLYMHMLTTHILTHWHVTVMVVLYSCSTSTANDEIVGDQSLWACSAANDLTLAGLSKEVRHHNV